MAEIVKSGQQSNADLESKMKQLYENQSDELNVSKSRQEKELTCLKTKLGSLEAKNKELVKRNEQLTENGKKSKLIVKKLVIKVNEFSTNSKRLTVDFAMIKDKQEQCLRELDESKPKTTK